MSNEENKRTRRIWMPMYWGDYLRKTMHLTHVQQAAYIYLIAAYWETGGLPTEDEGLAAVTRLSLEDWLKHKPVLQAYFRKNWRHDRIDEELAKSDARADSAREKAGKKWTRQKRGSDRVENAAADAGADAGADAAASAGACADASAGEMQVIVTDTTLSGKGSVSSPSSLSSQEVGSSYPREVSTPLREGNPETNVFNFGRGRR